MQPLLPPDPSQKQKKLLPKLLKGAGLGIGMATIAGVTGSAWWCWNFIQSDLAPMVQQDLKRQINRPITIGELQSVQWGKLSFGKSEIPAYIKKAQGQSLRDQDQAVVESVDVEFNLLEAIATRTLDLNITLNKPQIFLDEDPDSNWVDLNLSSSDGDNWVKINVNRIQINEGTIQLNPLRTAQRTLNEFNGSLNIKQNNQLFNLKGNTQVNSGGEIAFKGRFNNQSKTLEIETKSKQLNLPPLIGILPTELPFEVKAGKLNGNIDLKYRPQQPLLVKSNSTTKGLSVYVPAEDVQFKAEQFKGQIQLDVPNGRPVELRGDGTIKNGATSVPEDLVLSTGRSQRQVAQNINGAVKFLGKKQRFWSDLTATLPRGGDIKVTGVTSFLEQKADLELTGKNIPASILDQAFKLPLNVTSGIINGTINLKLNKGQRPWVDGIAQLQNTNFQISGLPQAFNQTQGKIRLKGLTTTLENLTGKYGDIAITANGSIDPDRGYSLEGVTQPIEINRGLKTLGVTELPFPVQGDFVSNNLSVTGKINNPILQGSVQSSTALSFDKVPVKSASAQFSLERLRLEISKIDAIPESGGSIQGSAQYNILGTEPWTAQFNAQHIPGNAFVSFYNADPGFNLGKVNSQIDLEVFSDRYRLDMDLQAPEGEFPASGKLIATPGRIDLRQITAKVPGGDLLANGQIVNGLIDLETKIPGINLVQYSDALRGKLAGHLKITAPVENFSSKTAIATGNLQLTEGISLIDNPINAQVRWNGKHIEIQKAIAPGFYAQGIMGAILEGESAPQLTTLDLNIQQKNYELASLPFELPANSKLSGKTNLIGKLSGQVYAPRLVGDIETDNLQVNDLPFETALVGSIVYDSKEGLNLKSKGQTDQVDLVLNAQQEPTSFYIKNQTGVASGKTIQPGQLAVEINQVPLTGLNWDVVHEYGYGRVSGKASGNFLVSIPTYDMAGPLTVDQPAIGPFKGDKLAGQFQIQNGVIALKNTALNQRNNQFLINASLIPDTNPKFSGDVTIANAQIEDAIIALETLEYIQPQIGEDPNYGKADVIQTQPVGQPQAPLILQLQRLTEIQELRRRQQELEATFSQIPSWNELTGAMKGKITFNGSANTGIQANFDLQGDQVYWSSIELQDILANGSYRNNELEFQQFSINANGGNLAFKGKLGQQSAGTLKISRLPLGDFSLLFASTLPIEGYLDAEATLAGSLENPDINGQITLSESQINLSDIQTAMAQFSFAQARLDLAGFVDINTPDPVRFEGSIPYSFPFMSAKPLSEALNLKLQVKNEGLSLLNLFTDQIEWVEGNGEVDIALQGTLKKPQILGRVLLENATLDSLTLPAPLSQVNGELNFNQETVQITNFQGAFSDGKLSAKGSLPIFNSNRQQAQVPAGSKTLLVQLDDLALDVKGLYKGDVNGDLLIGGSVLTPEVGGTVTLRNGQIVLSDATAFTGDSSTNPISPSLEIEPELANNQPLQFDNLVVRLDEKVNILQQPLLNFSTEGELTVNGSIDSPRPEGTVVFTKGEVNLFTSFFRLNRQKKNFAQFTPKYGLDPYLNINLMTTVSEVNSGRNERLNDIEDPLAGSLGSIESVRIRANIDGQASKLLSNLEQTIELTSSPNRSENEIIALLSGGVAEAIQGGNTDLALANIASSAVLNRVQSYVDDAFGGRAVFRLFPVLIPNEAERSVLAFGGEFGYDISDDLSVSVLQVLTGTDDPTRFNVSYDINEAFRARASISIDGEAAGLLEYRFRF